MIEAYNNQDEETYSKIFNARSKHFENLLAIEDVLVYYGNFSVADIEKMKVIERRFHLQKVRERAERRQKEIQNASHRIR